MPASAVTTWSAGAWSTRRESAPVRRTASSREGRAPSPRSVPPPTKATASFLGGSAGHGLGRLLDRGRLEDEARDHALDGVVGRGPGALARHHRCTSPDFTAGCSTPPGPGFSPQSRERGEDLARVEGLLRVEGGADPLHGLEVGLAEHVGHVGGLLGAHAVLPGDGAAAPHAHAQDVAAQVLGPLLLAAVPGVVEHERVEVAVAGVEDVGDPQAVVLGHRLDLAQHRRDLGAGDGAVLDQVVGGDAPHRGEGALAPLPHELPLGLAPRQPQLERARLAGDLHRACGEVLHLGRRARRRP